MSDLPLPKVSVCLLTYNRAHALPGTLDSLLAQTHPDFELIVNDDRSPDNTEEVCRAYERRDARVRYYKNPVNLRYAGNQNAAILRANCEYVAIVHDGDIYRPDLLEQWTRALVQEPTAALVFNALEQMNAEGEVIGVYRNPYGRLVNGMELFDEMVLRPDSPIFGIVMVRKSCVVSTGPFDPRIATLADVDMWLRLLLRYDAAYIPEPLLRIAPREAGHHNNIKNWRVRGEHELIFALNSARRYPGQPDKVAALRRRMMPMLWRLRVRQVLACVRHAEIDAAVEGFRFITNNLDFAQGASPDCVLDWPTAARTIEG